MRNITKVIKGLGTTNIISVKSDDDNVEKVLSDIEMLIQGYDRLWSIYSPDSLVTTLNKKGEVYTFSSKTIDIIKRLTEQLHRYQYSACLLLEMRHWIVMKMLHQAMRMLLRYALDLQFTNNNEQLASSGKGHKKR